MKRIASLITALLAVVLLAAPVSAAPSSSISLDQAQPVSPGSQVTFTVTGSKAVSVQNTCSSSDGSQFSQETLPVGSTFEIPSFAAICSAYVLDANDHRLRNRGNYVSVHYCASNTCFID